MDELGFYVPSTVFQSFRDDLGKRELVFVLLVYLFVCFARVWLTAVCDCDIPWTFL